MSNYYYFRNVNSGDVHRSPSLTTRTGQDYEQLTKAEGARIYREQARQELRKMLKPGATVYVKQNSVSRSGMYRRLELYIIKKGELRRITHSAAIVMDWPQNDDGIGVGGCGMDMHFHTVYTLARYLFPKGFKEKNMAGGKTEQRDGGSALKHSSL